MIIIIKQSRISRQKLKKSKHNPNVNQIHKKRNFAYLINGKCQRYTIELNTLLFIINN